jgi:hypothetical protein
MTNARERVVYILGAGFSAPLGLPVVRDFYVRSKDVYFSDRTKYQYFEKVFDTIDRLATIKNFFKADLLDIEEVLSILEMRDQLEGSVSSSLFRRYICDVITQCTPQLQKTVHDKDNWGTNLLGQNGSWSGYAALVANFWSCYVFRETQGGIFRLEMSKSDVGYDVISLNYDLVLELTAKHLGEAFNSDSKPAFRRTREEVSNESDDPCLVKLHGSVDTGDVIPPTWRKALSGDLVALWASARDILSKANHIRVLGYSLPAADTYVRYLLKAAASESRHLKTIDIITLDGDGSTRARYDDLVNFKFYRFANARVEKYLYGVQTHTYTPTKYFDMPAVQFTFLERYHNNFMTGSA